MAARKGTGTSSKVHVVPLTQEKQSLKRVGKLPQVTDLISGGTELFKLMLEVASMHHMKLPS